MCYVAAVTSEEDEIFHGAELISVFSPDLL